MKLTRSLLAVPLLAFASDVWQPLKVDKTVAIQLPTTAEEVNFYSWLSPAELRKLPPARRIRMWVARTPQSLCAIMRIPNPDKQRVNKQDSPQRRAFYERVEHNSIAEAHGQLLTHTTFSVAGLTGFEFMYRAPNTYSNQQDLFYTRSLVLDSICYSLIFRPTSPSTNLGRASTDQRLRFFNSLTVKP